MIYSLILFKTEILLLFFFLLYIAYYLMWFVFVFIWRLRYIFWLKKIKATSTPTVVELNEEQNQHLETYTEVKSQISDDEKLKVFELIKKVKLNISKWEYDLAKNQIVEWLAIDKFNIELNSELAWIYILEQDYLKAEYVYKDLLLVHEWNFDILKKLWYILTMQEKYDMALEMYKKAFDINCDDLEIINMLAHLSYMKNHYNDSIEYLKIILKQKPRDIETLILLAWSYKMTLNIDDAINTYQRALEIEPYNEEIKKEIKILKTPIIPEIQENEENLDTIQEDLVLNNDYDVPDITIVPEELQPIAENKQ